MIKSTTCLCNYPQANCIIIAFVCLLVRLCFYALHANHMCYYCLQLHVDVVIFIEIITPCLINSTIILCLWLHGSPFVVVCCVWFVRACVCVCVWLPCAASPIIKVGWGPDWQYEMFRDGGDRKPSGTAASDQLWLIVGIGWVTNLITDLTVWRTSMIYLEICYWSNTAWFQNTFLMLF